MSKKKLDFSKLKIGTEVYGFPDNKKGMITSINSSLYMIKVDYPDGSWGEYRFDGANEYHPYFSLISTRPFVLPEAFCDEPLPDIKKGTVVFVRNKKSDTWKVRVFSSFREDGKVVCFRDFGNSDGVEWFCEYRLDNPFLEQ